MNSKDLHLFVDKVDAKLFKCVEFKNLKTNNIQDTNEVDFFHGGINKCVVTHVHKVSEETAKDILDDWANSNIDSIYILGLVNPFSSNLNTRIFIMIW